MAKIDGYLTTEMPIERLLNYGVQSLSDTELLSIVLRTGTQGVNVLELSRNILREFRGFREISNLDVNELQKIPGVGRVKAAQIVSVFEIAKRLDSIKRTDLPSGTSPENIYKYIKKKVRFSDREQFFVLALNSRYEIIHEYLVSIGTTTKTFAEPKMIFKYALKIGAYAICVCHNHPTGYLSPSKEDIMLTKRLMEVGTLLDVPLIDHIIIGENDFYSMKSKGDI